MIMGFIHKLTFLPRFVRQGFFKWFNPIMFQSAGATIGSKFTAYNRVYLKFYKGAKLTIGDNFTLFSGDTINPIAKNIKASFFLNNNAELIIGNHVGMSSPTIRCNEKITIGDNVRLGALVTILDTDSHSLNYLDRRIGGETDKRNTKNKPVIIEDDALIGAYSIILKGSHIGARSIIGAGSVVAGDIPADCIAAGNPCKVIKSLKISK